MREDAMNTPDDIHVDDSLWPLVHVRFLGVPSTPQVEAYLARMTSLVERGEPYVSILDSSRMTGMGPPQQRHLQAAWKKRHAEQLKVLNLGTAFVITSPLVRLAVSTVFYLTPMHSPYLIAASLPQTVAWAVQRLEASGLHAAAERVRHAFGLGASRHAGP
jgi:hypothetical protein